MKPLHLILIGSLVVNAALAGYWFKSSRKAGGDGADFTSVSDAGHKLDSRSKPREQGTVDDESHIIVQPPAARPMTWEEIQSDDLKEFIARLRAVDCPEETIVDIILAAVNHRYAALRRELWPEQYQEYKYWQTERPRDREKMREQRQRWRRERELQKEKSALLVELLGFDPERQQRLEEGLEDFTSWQEQQVAFLPESKREAVLQILEDFQDKEQEMHVANAGIWDAQAREERRRLEAEKLTALATVLSPEELREYELRQSQTATQLGFDLRNLQITRSEYEAIFDIRKKYGDSIYSYAELDEAERKQASANRKSMNEELAAALGAETYKQYERSQDYHYQQLKSLAKRNDLPANTADQVYDFKSVAEEGAKKLRENQQLTQEQRLAAMQELRAETEAALKRTLGEKAYQSYLRNGAWWLNTISPQRRSGN